jgi:pimeloyl-ACP methyl ester carboxylesterase
VVTHSVIYVPGLGDKRTRGQRFLISTWRLWRVQPHLVQMNWAEDKDFEPKLQKLLGKIDELIAQDHKVSLVGASAGAGAVINALAARKDKVSGVVCICGKVNNPEGIGDNYRRYSPAFVDSAYRVQSSLDQLDFETDRSRIQSRYAFFDPVIPTKDSQVVGGQNKTVLSIGHSVTIVTQLLFGAPFFLHFLKRLAPVIQS